MNAGKKMSFPHYKTWIITPFLGLNYNLELKKKVIPSFLEIMVDEQKQNNFYILLIIIKKKTKIVFWKQILSGFIKLFQFHIWDLTEKETLRKPVRAEGHYSSKPLRVSNTASLHCLLHPAILQGRRVAGRIWIPVLAVLPFSG